MTASEAIRGHGWQRSGGRIYPTLTGATGAAQAWPTPDEGVFNYSETPKSFDQRREKLKAKGYNGNGMGTVLSVEAKRWPTPAAQDCYLNPEWVEMLMGFPAGWTAIDGPPHPDHTSTHTSHPAPDHNSPPTSSD